MFLSKPYSEKMPKIVIIASKNPVKINACQIGFQQMFPEHTFLLNSITVSSGVSNQPKSDQETLDGALNRTANAIEVQPVADFWVGIEGGIETIQHQLAAFAWVVIRTKKYISKSRTGTFILPAAISMIIHTGKELGEADDIVFRRKNTKQENGAVGLLTNNIIDRCNLYSHAVILALIPFKNPELYLDASLLDEAGT